MSSNLSTAPEEGKKVYATRSRDSGTSESIAALPEAMQQTTKYSSETPLLILENESEHDIQYKTCSWVHTSGLMLSEYIVLAIMSFPWSYSVLGIVPGIILTLFVASTVLYTGLTIIDYCERFPHLKNVCDIGQHLFWGQKWAWYATLVCFLANNTLIQGLHVLVGAKYLNTVTDHSLCTVKFGVIVACISFVVSVPRTFSSLSKVAYFSAATMFIAVVLAMIFAGVQDHPYGYDGTPVTFRAFPEKGTTFVQGMGAFLNIVYTFVGQITYPQFISEMQRPAEFRKVLYIVTTCEIVIFTLAGVIIYVYVGNEYMSAPAFGSLTRTFKIIAFSFAVPTIIFAGSLYSNVSGRLLFFTFFKRSKHLYSHTTVGWLTWIGILALTWVGAFIIAEVVPFFSDLLSLMSSLFDCWFGFVFWGMAYFKLKEAKYQNPRYYSQLTASEKFHFFIAIFLIAVGLFILGPGLYAAIDSIILNYQDDAYGTVFSCASNGS
ncbi:KLTH0B00836p [Lachancea thermotolerans CBS 6340]|uniref:KLTH0B00836p n=1 Tax=Lachancea thermotolerans (strain ATCC 56472 / CBS 6340 / NRRL Y-8284) TaxID=559295 RepID=C5DC79_LACTC|nr:KLTH0B00836p [Lachancea thermotolerans CBS 6340]CAR21390.1 KLTH0B00836p [Lachancea thermotolerans CBS 6340]